MKKFQILFFILIASTLSAQIKVTIKGKITDSQYSNHAIEYSVFKKTHKLDLTKIIDFKTGNFGEFNIAFSLDKSQPICIMRSDFEGLYYLAFWGEGNIFIDGEINEQVTFAGDNKLANNLLNSIKIAEKKHDDILSLWHDDSQMQNPVEDKIYRRDQNKLLIDLDTDYKSNIEKKVPLQLDNWIATEIKAFGLLCEAEYINKKSKSMQNKKIEEHYLSQNKSSDEFIKAFQKEEYYIGEQKSFVDALKTFPESALLSDYFLKYFELCCAHNADFNYSSTNNYPLYSEILGSIKVSPENANMNYHNNDNNEPYKSAIRIFNSRAIINWVKTNMADKPKFLEYILVKTVNI